MRSSMVCDLLFCMFLSSCARLAPSALPPTPTTIASTPAPRQQGVTQRTSRRLRSAATITTGDPYSTAVLSDAPIAYYRLDDSGTVAHDSSPSGFNGTIGSSVVSGAAGLLTSSADSGMGFPGVRASTGIVLVPPNAAFTVSSQITVECLLSFPSVPAAYAVALAYGSDASYAPYDLYFLAGKLFAQFALSSGVLVVSTPSALQPNTTYYVVATYNGSTGSLYLNGALVASASKTGTFINYDSSHGLAIGDDAGLSDPPFAGTVDEAAIYAKPLTAARVQAHYAAGTQAPGPTPPPTPTPSPTPTPTSTPSPTPSPSSTPPPVSGGYAAAVLASKPTAYYRLDETSGSVAHDSSPNALNGTIGTSATLGAPGLLQSSSDAAMTFPGIQSTAGIVSVPPNALLRPSALVSIECLLRFASVPRTYAVPLSYGSDATYAPYDLYFASGHLDAQIDLSSGAIVLSSPGALQANTTYHVVVTYDGTTMTLYLNGNAVASGTRTGTIAGYDLTHGLAIGDDAGLSDPGYAGTVDEVAIYGRALSASEVVTHYNATLSSQPPPPTPTPPPSTKYVDWSTFGYDLARTGYNPNETTIGTSNVANLHQIWSQSFGGPLVAEPVLAQGVSINGSTQNVLYVGTQTGLFTAVNADTGAVIWQKHLGTVSYICSSYPFGVAGTATFDRKTNRVYVADGQDQLHALDMATGAEAGGWPGTVATIPDHNFIYSALTFNPANGLIYAETSSTCDISPWTGRIDVFNTSSAALAASFYPTQGQSGGGIWGYGGASIDTGTSDVYVAVGNADTSGGNPQNYGYAENIVQLDPMLNLLAANYPGLPASPDADFGATPTLYQAAGCQPQLAAMNKSGVLVVYNRNAIASGPVQVIQMSPPTDSGNFIGLPAFSPVTGMLYVGVPTDLPSGIYMHGLAALLVQPNCTLSLAWQQVFGVNGSTVPYDAPRSPPSVANGVVYAGDGIGQHVRAFSAQTGALLWDSGSTIAGQTFTQPVIDGHLFVSSYDGVLHAYGL
ncbi:hypothetical protein EPN44_15895 [bacterium]|nr:MAG: hypothetical protein EPN44_15895 [bacterium]